MASSMDTSKQQQVNAWASYDQTAKNARNLSSGQQQRVSSGSAGGEVSRTSHHGSNRSLGRSLGRSRHGMQYDLVNSHHGLDLSRSRHHAPALLLGHSVSVEFTLSRKGSNEDDDVEDYALGFFQRLGRGKGWPAPKVDQVDTEMLYPEIRRKICDTFAVFFEAATSTSNATDTDEEGNSLLRLVYDTFNATMPWTQTYYKNSIVLFVDLCLRGISQVYFQNNPLSGVLILIGMFVQSTRIATHGVLALVSGNLIAFLLGFDKGLARSGLFGYNSFLVGLALATFDSQATGDKVTDYNASVLVASVFFAMFSSILFVMLGKMLVHYKAPPLTLPFNLATLTFLVAMANMERVDIESVREVRLPDYVVPEDTDLFNDITAGQFFAGTIRGLGQVYLANNLASGFLVLAGIFVCSRIGAMAALVGSAVGAMTALLTGVPVTVIENGMYGFNSSLAFTAMFFFYAPSLGAAILGLFAAVLGVICQQALAAMFEPYGLPFLTLPFCVATLPFIILQGTTTIVVPIPLANMTVPEDHFNKVSTLTDGLSFIMDAIKKIGLDGTEGEMEEGDQDDNHGPGLHMLTSQGLSRKMKRSLNQISLALAEDPASSEEKTRCCSWSNSNYAKLYRIEKSACDIFNAMDRQEGANHLTFDQVTSAFFACGLEDKEGLYFATMILRLLDMDNSSTITKQEFVAFAVVSQSICVLRQKISRFVEFVDEKENEMVDFDEIDAALGYLGQPVMSEDDRVRLAMEFSGNADLDVFDMDVVELINFVVVSKVKELVTLHDPNADNRQSRVLYSVRRKEVDC